jgi:hypothetical protein
MDRDDGYDDDPISTGDTAMAIEATEPIYNYKAWLYRDASGIQCTHGGKYCVLCCNITIAEEEDEEEDTEGGGSDEMKKRASVQGSFRENYHSIVNTIHVLVEQQKTIHFIVESVYQYYEKHIRMTSPPYLNPVTDKWEEHPHWDRDTITNHLMHSTDPIISSLFGDVCTLMLRRLIMETCNTTVASKSKSVNRETAKDLCDYIDRLNKHRKDELTIRGMIETAKTRKQRGRAGKA